MEIKIKTALGALVPQYSTAESAGADVHAYLDKPVVCPAGGWIAVPTGVFLEIPAGYEVQVRPRSGMALRHGITVLNAPGTIDSDYRGELKIVLINHSKQDYTITHGDRIAQLVAARVEKIQFTPTEQIGSSPRGEGGFGSTGK